MTVYFLDSLVGGAGPGNRGADFATFRAPSLPGSGTFQLYTIDWIKRGRPTSIEITLPLVEDARPLIGAPS